MKVPFRTAIVHPAYSEAEIANSFRETCRRTLFLRSSTDRELTPSAPGSLGATPFQVSGRPATTGVSYIYELPRFTESKMSETVATVPAEAIAAFNAYRQNLRWAKVHGESLERYKGMYVAVANGKVLDSSKEEAGLLARYAEIPGVYVALVIQRGLKWVL
ncbi:MAG: DUF5678 domain-containing protein [Thermoplasmata archaeon]